MTARTMAGPKRRRAYALLGLCLYVAAFWLWASSGFPAQEQICGNPHKASQHNCAAREIIAFGHWVHVFHDELLVVGTFLLAIVVIFQIRDTRKSSERQLRAYLNIVVGTAYRQGGMKGFRFEFRPIILNTGQTPAYNVNSLTGVRFLTLEEAESFDFSISPIGTVGVLTLGPKQDRFTRSIFDRVLTKTELKEFLRGTRHFFVYGTVWYDDAFDKPRYTNYCFAISGWSKRGGGTPNWQTTTRHNDSD